MPVVAALYTLDGRAVQSAPEATHHRRRRLRTGVGRGRRRPAQRHALLRRGREARHRRPHPRRPARRSALGRDGGRVRLGDLGPPDADHTGRVVHQRARRTGAGRRQRRRRQLVERRRRRAGEAARPSTVRSLPRNASRVWTVDRNGTEVTLAGTALGNGYALLFEQETDKLYGDLRAAQHQRDVTLLAVLAGTRRRARRVPGRPRPGRPPGPGPHPRAAGEQRGPCPRGRCRRAGSAS